MMKAKNIHQSNAELRIEIRSNSCMATNVGLNLSQKLVDDSLRDAASLDDQKDALSEIQLTDHAKFL